MSSDRQYPADPEEFLRRLSAEPSARPTESKPRTRLEVLGMRSRHEADRILKRFHVPQAHRRLLWDE